MKKRALVLFLILSILSTLCFVSYADGNAFTVGMLSDKKAVSKGDTFTVTISVNQISTPNGIIGIDIPVVYDATVLTLTTKEAILPSIWAYGVDFSTPNQGNYVIRLLNDGWSDADFNAGVFDDGALGYKLTFKVETDAVKNTEIYVDSENLACTTAKDYMNLPGTSASLKIALNSKEELSEESDDNPFYSLTGDESYAEYISQVEGGSTDVDTSVEEPTEQSSEQGEGVTSEGTEGDESEIISVDGSGVASDETESAAESSKESEGAVVGETSSSDESKGEEGGFGGILLYIIIGCVVIAAGSVLFFVMKNKKEANDMNPVNPS